MLTFGYTLPQMKIAPALSKNLKLLFKGTKTASRIFNGVLPRNMSLLLALSIKQSNFGTWELHRWSLKWHSKQVTVILTSWAGTQIPNSSWPQETTRVNSEFGIYVCLEMQPDPQTKKSLTLLPKLGGTLRPSHPFNSSQEKSLFLQFVQRIINWPFGTSQ